MQAPQFWPQPVRRTACSALSRSAYIRRATSSNVTPAHSHRVMAGATRGVRGPRGGAGVGAGGWMLVAISFEPLTA
jgi:hypothetical protein